MRLVRKELYRPDLTIKAFCKHDVSDVSIQLEISLPERRSGETSLQTLHTENKTKFIQTPRVVAYYSQAAHNSIGIRANVVKFFMKYYVSAGRRKE